MNDNGWVTRLRKAQENGNGKAIAKLRLKKRLGIESERVEETIDFSSFWVCQYQVKVKK